MDDIAPMKIIIAAIAIALFAQPLRAADEPQFLGEFNPEDACKGPLSTPVCAYKTWFYCRIADEEEMCALVLGKGPAKPWHDEPWKYPLSTLMSGPMSVYGFGFIGSRKVTAERFSGAKGAQKLLGSTEVMDTYSDPNDPNIAYVGSEFYAEKKPGEWHIVGWTIDVEGGKGELACEEPGSQGNDICKLRVKGLKSWANYMREKKSPN
jgi:hypothetical protein